MAQSVVESGRAIIRRGALLTDRDRDRLLHETLGRWFGFSSLRPLQKEAIDAALDGRDGANHSLETVATLVLDLTVLCCCQSLPPELRTAVWPH